MPLQVYVDTSDRALVLLVGFGASGSKAASLLAEDRAGLASWRGMLNDDPGPGLDSFATVG